MSFSLLAKLRGTREKMGPLWWYALLMFLFSRLGDLINLYVGLFLVPDVVSLDKIGAILPLTQLAGFAALPLGIVVTVSLKYLSLFEARGELGRARLLLRDMLAVAGAMAIAVILYVSVSREFVERRLNLESPAIVWFVAAVAACGFLAPVTMTIAQSMKAFKRIALSTVLGPAVRIVVLFAVLERLQLVGYLAATLASLMAVIIVLGSGARRLWAEGVCCESYSPYKVDMVKYAIPVGITLVATAIQTTVEPWVIRQRLSELDSAGYYMAMQFGRIPQWVAPAMLPFLFPLVSDRHEKGESTRGMHIQTLIVVAAIGLAVTLVLVFAARHLFMFRDAWHVYQDYAPFVWRVALVSTLSVFVICHTTHQNACRRFKYLYYLVPTALLESVALYGLMGWEAFGPWLPRGLWETVAAWDVRNLGFIVAVMLAVRGVQACCVLLEVVAGGLRAAHHGKTASSVPCCSP